MSLSAILLLLPPPPEAVALARYDTFLRSAPLHEVSVQVRFGDGRPLPMSFRFARDGRYLVSAKDGATDVSVGHDGTRLRELDRNARQYDETNVADTRVPMRMLESLREVTPNFLAANSARDWFPQESKWTLTPGPNGQETVKGETKSEQRGMVAEAFTQVVLDGQGRPSSIRFYSRSPMGARDVTYTFSGWSTPAITATTFSLPQPDGYSPYSLSEDIANLPIGGKLEWAPARRGTEVADLAAMAKAKGLLIAVLSGNEGPSATADGPLAELEKAGVAVARIEADGPATGNRWSAPEIVARLAPPATPYFALVTPDGTVRRIWIGTDPAWAAEARQEFGR